MVEASGFTLRQERALAICPKISSTISIPCSIAIISEVIRLHKTTRGTTPVQRTLLAMSLVDISASFAWFLSTWAVPEGTFAYAAGNKASCNFQGFLLQLAIGAPLYNSSLAIFYLLMIKRRWTDDQLKKIEMAVHVLILSFAIGTSILLLFLEQYNQVGAVCWVIGDPPDCGNSSFQGSDTPCERGDHAYLYGLVLFYGPLWVCVIACCTSMVILWLEVRTTHSRSRRHSSAIVGMKHSTNRSGRDERKVAIQAILFSLTFLITWMPSTLWSVAHWFNWSHYGLDIAAAVAEPLQGLWNFLIFLKSRPETVARIRNTLAYIFPCCITSPPCHASSSRHSSELLQSFAAGLRKGTSGFTSSRMLSELEGPSLHSPFGEGSDEEPQPNAAVSPLDIMLEMSESSMGSASYASFLDGEDADVDHVSEDERKKTEPALPPNTLGPDGESSSGSDRSFLTEPPNKSTSSDPRDISNSESKSEVADNEDTLQDTCSDSDKPCGRSEDEKETACSTDFEDGDSEEEANYSRTDDAVEKQLPQNHDNHSGEGNMSQELNNMEKETLVDDPETESDTEQNSVYKAEASAISALLVNDSSSRITPEMDPAEQDQLYFA